MKVCMFCDVECSDEDKVCTSCGGTEFHSKCNNCGTVFDSGFCPNCGVREGEKPKVCPECQTRYFSNACPSCGYIRTVKKQVSGTYNPQQIASSYHADDQTVTGWYKSTNQSVKNKQQTKKDDTDWLKILLWIFFPVVMLIKCFIDMFR